MANISSHGARKIAELKVEYRLGNVDNGMLIEYVYVLTSDRRILRAARYPLAASSYDRRRSAYRLVAKIKPTAENPMKVFRTYVERQAHRFNSEVKA